MVQMKNVFDVNTKTDRYDGNVFCTKNAAPVYSERSDEIIEELFEMEETPSKSGPFIILDCVSTLLAALGAVALMQMLFEKEYTLAQAFLERPVILSVGLLGAVLMAVLKIKEKREKKENEEKTAQKEIKDEKLFAELEELSQKAYKKADIPQGAFTLEVISDSYEIKNDKKVPTFKFMSMNLPMEAYVQNHALCFWDGAREIAIPLRDIKKIEYKKKRRRLAGWFKQVSFKDKQYKQYRVRDWELGIIIPGYYSMEIHSVWGEYEIQVPNYEEKVVRMIETLLTRG